MEEEIKDGSKRKNILSSYKGCSRLQHFPSKSKNCVVGNVSENVFHQGGANLDAADRFKRAEESLRTVMYLSCWGPN